MKHFSTFFQRPSPQAPRDPVSGQELISLVSWDKFSSRLDQMAPHSCPFLVSNFDVFHKPRSLPPLPRKIHGRKDGKHHLPPVFVLNHLYPIFPPVPFVCIVWDKGQKASRHVEKYFGIFGTNLEEIRENLVEIQNHSMIFLTTD